jgi:hypothetical protein
MRACPDCGTVTREQAESDLIERAVRIVEVLRDKPGLDRGELKERVSNSFRPSLTLEATTFNAIKLLVALGVVTERRWVQRINHYLAVPGQHRVRSWFWRRSVVSAADIAVINARLEGLETQTAILTRCTKQGWTPPAVTS